MFYQYTILLSCKLGKSLLLLFFIFFIKNKSSSIIYEKKPYDDINNNIKMKFRSFNRENACRKVKHRDTITPFSPNVLTAIRQGMPISSMDANKDSNECVKGTAGKDIIQKIYMYNTYTLTSCYDTWNGIHVHTNNLKCLDIWCWNNTFL